MNNIVKNENCLACGGSNLELILNLKEQPLANSFKSNKNDNENKYPLAVNLCHDCFHLQLTHSVDPKIIYENYLYVSGTSKTLKDYSDWFANFVNETITYKTNRILDIGCNDGTQLDSFKKMGYITYGIDPAKNIHSSSSKKHNIICDFFGPEVFEKLNYKYDAIIAQNVCAHNPNPLLFLQTCFKLMSDHTLLFVQTSQADMVLNNEFDTIYHEHINFFNINSMHKLSKRANLNLISAFKTPIHGNSYIFVFSKTKLKTNYINNLILMENKLQDTTTYDNWVKNVNSNMFTLKSTLENFKKQDCILIGYGAAAKGNTLLNFTSIELDYIIDDNANKQGMFTPGTNIEVVPITKLNEISNDTKIVFIPLAWNFYKEIKHRITTVRNNKNDCFVKYFPNVEIENV